MLGYHKPRPLLLTTRFGIHTFSMKFSIDVLVLNNRNQIIKLKPNITPNRLFFWNPFHQKVVELPEGFIKNNKLTKGQKITLVEINM